jgi:glycosyltransferase involved in cell wall biosynthesis
MGCSTHGFRVFAHFNWSRFAGTVQAIMEPVCASIGIIAWNEEDSLAAMLESLFGQTLFGELGRRGLRAEVVCVANGCTDGTARVAERVFEAQADRHLWREWFCCRVASLAERGKLNAWNQFVHALSAREARYLLLMDADIVIHREETLWTMLSVLEEDAQASVAVDRPCKHLRFKARKSIREQMSLAASDMTSAAPAQLCAQLYCIRAEVARNIYLPKDLAACEDGFIKALVCTDFLEHEVWPRRIRLAEGAEHTFEAYTTLGSIARNQKRQILGQTMVHLLIDLNLKALSPGERARLAEILQRRDMEDPWWLKRLVAAHLRRSRFFWRLYPGLLRHRFDRLLKVTGWKRVACAPVAVVGFALALVSGFLAWRALKRGATDYWPRENRLGLAGRESLPASAPSTPDRLPANRAKDNLCTAPYPKRSAG